MTSQARSTGAIADSTRLAATRDAWAEAWPRALAVWSRFTRLRPPLLCTDRRQARNEGLTGSFAMIRLVDQAIIVSLPDVVDSHVEDYGVEILAHEIGHHVLAPATLTDHTRMIARMRWALPTLEDQAGLVANLYTDLLINDRLQRSAELRIADVYRALAWGEGHAEIEAGAHRRVPDKGALWTVYTRIFEVLWNLPRGSLGGGPADDRVEGDAWLGARLIRSYSRDWLDGSGRFASLLLPYLVDDQEERQWTRRLYDTRAAAAGGQVSGLSDAEPAETEGAIHPAADPELAGDGGALADGVGEAPREQVPARVGGNQGQTREPFEYGEILRSAGLVLSDHDVAVRYYREQALPYLVPFPSRPVPRLLDTYPEGLESWDLGHPLDAIDWLQTLMISPQVIPGVTTVQRVWGTGEGRDPKPRPLDLDLYADSSGSMANPQRQISFPALAGAVICLSALRVGARVQATLWSGKRQFQTTAGFVRDEESVLRVLTGYFGGATAFPIHVLRDTWQSPSSSLRPCHLMVVSDDGVSTMFDRDEEGNSGWDISRAALEHAGGGGTLVLQMPRGWDDTRKTKTKPADDYFRKAYGAVRRARDEQGWDVHRVASWQDLLDFATAFSQTHYVPRPADGAGAAERGGARA